jgi:hypothetical protein
MTLPLHVRGTEEQKNGRFWLIRLHDPVILAWPFQPDGKIEMQVWPPDMFKTLGIERAHHYITGLLEYGGHDGRSYHFVNDPVLPRFLHLDEPTLHWSGILDFAHGYLYTPDLKGFLKSVPGFHFRMDGSSNANLQLDISRSTAASRRHGRSDSTR